jgi:nifR3 family TIM-barrel protein
MEKRTEKSASSLSVEGVILPGRIALAPMAAVSDSPYRRLCRKSGSAFAYSEFISSDALVHGSEISFKMLRHSIEERPVMIQIFGRDPHVMADAAQLVERAGADILDINMGCSVNRVAGGGAGAALLKDPAFAAKIVLEIKKRIRIPVTAKIRLGWDDASKNYFEVLKALEGSGIAMISVHGRTRAQAYGGRADWESIARIKDRATVPVFGNGDVRSYNDAVEKMTRFGVDGVLIGRAAIGNPWIFSSNYSENGPSLLETIDRMVEHFLDMEGFYGPERSLILFRKHAAKYIKGFPGAREFRIRVLTTESRNEFLDMCEKLKERNGDEIALCV